MHRLVFRRRRCCRRSRSRAVVFYPLSLSLSLWLLLASFVYRLLLLLRGRFDLHKSPSEQSKKEGEGIQYDGGGDVDGLDVGGGGGGSVSSSSNLHSRSEKRPTLGTPRDELLKACPRRNDAPLRPALAALLPRSSRPAGRSVPANCGPERSGARGDFAASSSPAIRQDGREARSKKRDEREKKLQWVQSSSRKRAKRQK